MRKIKDFIMTTSRQSVLTALAIFAILPQILTILLTTVGCGILSVFIWILRHLDKTKS